MTDQANLLVELDLENDGRWIAEVPAIAGALAYGATGRASGVLPDANAFAATM